QEARTSPGWSVSYAKWGQSWEADVDWTRGRIFEARGQYREADTAYHLSERGRRASAKMLANANRNSIPEARILQAVHLLIMAQARMKGKQGRLAEGEVDSRRALQGVLENQGKYHPSTVTAIIGLARNLIEQGRYEEAEKLARIAVNTDREIGVAEDSYSL